MIALAWKKLDAELTPSQIAALSRENIECGLTFGGFAVFHCPLKEDSEPALRMLKVSSSLRSAIRFPWMYHIMHISEWWTLACFKVPIRAWTTGLGRSAKLADRQPTCKCPDFTVAQGHMQSI